MQLVDKTVAFLAAIGAAVPGQEPHIFFASKHNAGMPPVPAIGWNLNLFLGLNRLHQLSGSDGSPPLISLFDAEGHDLWLRETHELAGTEDLEKHIVKPGPAKGDPGNKYVFGPGRVNYADDHFHKGTGYELGKSSLPNQGWRMFRHDTTQWNKWGHTDAAYVILEGMPYKGKVVRDYGGNAGSRRFQDLHIGGDPVCVSHFMLAQPPNEGRKRPDRRAVVRVSDWVIECATGGQPAWGWSNRWADVKVEEHQPPKCVWIGDGQVAKGRIHAVSSVQIRLDAFSWMVPERRPAEAKEEDFRARMPKEAANMCTEENIIIKQGPYDAYNLRMRMGAERLTEYKMGPEWPMASFVPGMGTEPEKRNVEFSASNVSALVGRSEAESKLFDGWLIQSDDPEHSARELCEDPASASPDAADWHRREFCRMSDRTLLPFCYGRRFKDAECWDPETRKVVVREVAKRDVEYEHVTDWRREVQMRE